MKLLTLHLKEGQKCHEARAQGHMCTSMTLLGSSPHTSTLRGAAHLCTLSLGCAHGEIADTLALHATKEWAATWRGRWRWRSRRHECDVRTCATDMHRELEPQCKQEGGQRIGASQRNTGAATASDWSPTAHSQLLQTWAVASQSYRQPST